MDGGCLVVWVLGCGRHACVYLIASAGWLADGLLRVRQGTEQRVREKDAQSLDDLAQRRFALLHMRLVRCL